MKYPKTQGPKDPREGPKDPRTQRPKDPETQGAKDRWADGADSEVAVFCEESVNGKPYGLEERTARFGEAIIRFAKRIPQNPVSNRLISQLVGAGTSIGANYSEADEGVSRRDYKKSIGTCKKEARETKFFLRMVATAEETLKQDARELWREAKELHLIFCSLYRK